MLNIKLKTGMKNIDTICKAVAVFGFGILAASSSPAGVLFSQPFNESGNYYSTIGYPNVHDDFTKASGGTISKVDWSGIDPDNDITGFTVNFYSDNCGSPGTELGSTAITGTAGETASGSDDGPYSINNYSAILPTAFTASLATEYYIQIVGTLGKPDDPGGFYWQTSS